MRTVYVQRASSGTSACCMEPWVSASISSEYSEYSESGDACHQTVSRGAAGPKAAWNKSGELLASSTLRSARVRRSPSLREQGRLRGRGGRRRADGGRDTCRRHGGRPPGRLGLDELGVGEDIGQLLALLVRALGWGGALLATLLASLLAPLLA